LPGRERLLEVDELFIAREEDEFVAHLTGMTIASLGMQGVGRQM
jgi:hypothetical protein